ncbi:hypothetical protein OTU49_001488, partial [Cherax quadricarinatus]
MSTNVICENEMLKRKVYKIELDNIAQQKRLQQLEKMVMELTCNRASSHVLDSHHHPPFNKSLSKDKCVEITEGISEKEKLFGRASEEFEQECMNNSDQLSGDVASLMEEFDRKGRENGIIYGMAISSSVADSEDLAETRSMDNMTTLYPTPSDSYAENVCRSPLPSLLTPSYHQSENSNINNYSYDSEPLISPQLCLTTPVLLTTEALREVEKHQDLYQENFNCEKKINEQIPCICSDTKSFELPTSTLEGKPVKKPAVTLALGSKVTPFSNLLAGLRQASNQVQHNGFTKNYCLTKGDKFVNSLHDTVSKNLHFVRPSGFSSPSSSVSGRICKWNHSLRLPLLSPLTGSHCSDLETHASDEEDLVVDEVVSFSMTGGNRHRSESFSSITGPCVPPDLLMDTGKACGELGIRLREVKEEEEEEEDDDLENNILLENALVPSEDADTPTLKAEHDQCVEMKLNLISEEVAIEPEEEWIEDFEVSNPGKELGTITSQVIDETLSLQTLQTNKIRYADGKDVKLPAGSIVLAVVNESGSLVPLPQLQVDPQTLSRAVTMDAHENLIDEEVDIETVTEKTPVLEAGDLDSLLAQFEASEAVNKSGDNSESLNKRKEIWRSKPIGTVASMPSGQRPSGSGHVLSQVSPTHQNIKDALPKEIIEKIKASTKRKSTQMLSEPLVVRKGRGVKQQDASHPHTKALRSVSQPIPQNAPDLRVPPPLDHDYCFSPEKLKKNKQNENYSNTSEVLFNKLPEYYTTIPRRDIKPSLSSEDSHDDGGKKDSGVESGDVSDASVETEERRKEGKDSRNSQGEWNDRQNEDINGYKNEVYNKLPAYMTDIGNSKPKDEIEEDINNIGEEKGDENSNKEKERISENSDKEKGEEKMINVKPVVKLIKRKLNLLEYRQRIRSAQSSCCPSPTPTDNIQDTSSSIPLPVSDLAGKMENIKTDNVEHKQMEECENNSNGHAVTEEDTEEGELKGDSDQETSVKPGSGNVSAECVKDFPYGVAKSSSSIEIKTLEKSLSVITSFYNSSASVNYSRRWKSSSHTSSSRRWSSSSRSCSRSPTHSKKRTSRNRRSSRGKRKRTHRHSQSSRSPHSSSRRRWSRSRSHSRSRSRSSSSNGNSSCSSSRSRSRSSPFKSRSRWSYSHRFSSRERRRYHSRSRSRSSSRYSRVSRSRSPVWRSSRRSRSPHYRLPIRPRRP